MSTISILILIILIIITILLVLLLTAKGYRPISSEMDRECGNDPVAYLGPNGILGCWSPSGIRYTGPHNQPYLWTLGYECPQGYTLAPGYDPSFGLCVLR